MLLTVTPNACIERTLQVPGFRAGGSYRVQERDVQVNVGGKGVNVARVANALGANSRALLWCGAGQRHWVATELEREAVDFRLVETGADTRTCLNILHGGGNTEIVEAGNALSAIDGDRMLQAFEHELISAGLVAICGSYPPTDSGFNAGEHLAELCRMAGEAGVRVILDGKGNAFAAALRKVRPWCIKPNLAEASELLGRNIENPGDEKSAMLDLVELADNVILSCGDRGCYFGTSAGTLFFRSPSIDTVSPVGSGDSLVGALTAKLLEGLDKREAIAWGVAAGAANAAQAKSGFCSQQDVAALLSQVEVETV